MTPLALAKTACANVLADGTCIMLDAAMRVVPIFPERLPHLRDAFEEAEPAICGAIHEEAAPCEALGPYWT